ncbi:SulT family ABC transporter periplasmic protein [Cupriavidus basilensis OR16]|uniref:SulT family ABC transporter periplasmic protein n=1 Tax=Cupriavidus basilensis OR16 TaxID=1127483 RepID=H1S2B8_9BURK|nr:ABC transporter permease [Cupriavidus basilensis]EHP43320.1 SulT family ABC transporter periplasmic protein [Cupriavidus basilensis OR16]
MEIGAATIAAFALLASGDGAIWFIVWTSLMVAVLGLAIAAVPAIGAAYLIATHDFPGRRVVVVVAQSFLSFPTVLVGLVLYLLFTRHGPLGGFSLLFTRSGMVLGQAVIGFPVVLAFALSTLQRADVRLRETAWVLGAGRWRTFLTVLRELRFGLMAALVAGFGRVVAEVGSALMIGGNIEGTTRTITTAIALETSKGEFAQGIALGIVLVALALLVNVMLAWLQGAGGFRR